MTRLFLISFPRSGQHLTEQVLRYLCEVNEIPYSYCEHYRCCQHVPCARGSLVQKNHDFSLDLDINPSHKYVVLYRRNVARQLESYYRYRIRKDHGHYSVTGLLRFARREFTYYTGFVEKWVCTSYTNVRVFDYHDLVERPIQEYTAMCSFLFPSGAFSSSSIQSITDQTFKHGKIRVIHDTPIFVLQQIENHIFSP